MPLILGTNSIKDTGYDVANSLRFNRGSSDYLDKTFSGAGSRTTWTISVWVKRANEHGTNSYIIDSGAGSGTSLYFGPAQIEFWDYQSGSYTGRLTTNAVYRDHSAWMHIVAVWDTTNGTAGNRMRLYVNGVEETSFATDTNPSSSQNSILNDGSTSVTIGRQGSIYSNLYMAEFCYIDGQALAADQFGEFDEDSGIWKPIDVSGLTFGTNGFYLDFEDSSALGNDAAGSNNFTVNNLTAIDQSTDTCTNNFATFNPLFPTAGTSVFSEGNLKLVASGSAGSGLSSFGLSKGKWYMEVKQTAVNEPLGNGESGICVVGDPTGNLGNVEGTAFAYGIRNYNGTKFENTSGSTSWHGNWTAGDIISVALDMDNHRVYFAKNGQYADGSGNWDEAFTGSPAYLSLSTAKTDYFLAMSQLHSSATETYELNFGSPSFSISSGNSDGNGYGNFEYSVPSGYFSLNTKNLAEYG